jgi:glycosyltransferase involved in cell wall biosynthesis
VLDELTTEATTVERTTSVAGPIVHVAVTYRSAGTEQMIVSLTSRTAREGVPTHVVVPPGPALDSLAQRLEAVGAVTHRIGPLYESERPQAQNFRDLYRLLRTIRPQVVHYHIPWAPLCFEAILAGAAARVPLRVRTEQNPISGPLPAKQRWKLALLDRMVQSLAMVSAGNLRTHLENGRRPERKCAVIENGIEMGRIRTSITPSERLAGRAQLGLPRDGCTFVMIGALETRKGVLDYLAAAASLAPRDDRLHFAVLGDGPLRDEADRFIAANGLAGRVSMLGHRSDVLDLLPLFDVFVQPSHYEGLSIAMLEALATGLPMVTTRVDGVEEVLPGGEGAEVVDGIDGLADGMARLADPARRAELACISTGRVRRLFTADRMCAEYEKLYEDRVPATRR